ncbi:penicillin-binding protein 2 [Desulfococcaceae bacterium OttesenSCG-928-F15]|nr:penicillin-binding protein 2 [Desulfococcaceae bacterium OttesenSCG-928-F15]
MMKKRHEPTLKKSRFILVTVIFTGLFLLVAGQAFRIQVLKNDLYTKEAEKLVSTTQDLVGNRGSILDTHGVPMAMSIDAVKIGIRPHYLPKDKEFDEVRDKIARITKISWKTKKELKAIFSRSNFTWLNHSAPPEVAEELLSYVKTLNIPENDKKNFVDVFKTSGRVYPHREIAAQLIGFTGTDGHGLEGLEQLYETVLKGETSQETLIRNRKNGFFNEDAPLLAENHGKDLVLTIDRHIQFFAENALAEAAMQAEAESGMAVVMSPKTGEILAMANYPSFNANTPLQYPAEYRRNRVVTDVFEPGSTLKVFLVAGALEQKFVEPNSIYYCENGMYNIGPQRIRDTKPHGWLSVKQIIKYSSNIGSVKISEALGRENLHQILTGFGFGKKTQIDFAGEMGGLLSHWRRWYPQDTGSIAFGQGISTTALQLVVAASAIANGGKLMQPYLIKEIRDPVTGEVQKKGPTLVRRVISPETSETVKAMMASVIEAGGTGVQAATYGYKVAGKTGTSQKQEKDGSYSQTRHIASFLGFAPVKDPEIVVLVVLDEPKKQQYGGTAAAPAFKKIVSESLAYMHVPPETVTPFTLAMLPKEN